MENFILLALIACVIVLFNNFSNLRKENDHLNSLNRKSKDDYNSLRKEIEEIKKQISRPDFVSENVVSKIEEIEKIPEQE